MLNRFKCICKYYDFLYCTKSLGDKYEKKMIDTRTKLLLVKQQL